MRDEKESGGCCRVCGERLPATGRGRPAVYCSRSCQARAYRRRRAERLAAQHSAAAATAAGGAPEERTSGTPGRRRRIAEAVWRIAADRGLEAASMREVAAEAGVSLRVVQYTFGSKHRLLTEALRLLHEENDRRARARIARLPDPADPRALLRAVLDEFLPLDEQRRAALRVFLAYFVRSLTDRELAAVFLHDEQPVEALVAELIRQSLTGAPGPATGPVPDPRREADLLVAGVSGLGMDVLLGRRPLAEVRTTIEHHLGRILGAERQPR